MKKKQNKTKVFVNVVEATFTDFSLVIFCLNN